MRQFYASDKKKREEVKRKKQEQKRLKRLNKRSKDSEQPHPLSTAIAKGDPSKAMPNG